MTAGDSLTPDVADRAVRLLQRTRELLLECRTIAEQLQVVVPSQESESTVAERIAHGVLVAALEEGLVTTLRHAMDVLGRFSTPAGVLGEQWLDEQERKLGASTDDPADRARRIRTAAPGPPMFPLRTRRAHLPIPA